MADETPRSPLADLANAQRRKREEERDAIERLSAKAETEVAAALAKWQVLQSTCTEAVRQINLELDGTGTSIDLRETDIPGVSRFKKITCRVLREGVMSNHQHLVLAPNSFGELQLTYNYQAGQKGVSEMRSYMHLTPEHISQTIYRFIEQALKS